MALVQCNINKVMKLFRRVVGRLNVTVPQLPGDDIDGLQRHVALHHVERDQVPAPARHGQHPRVTHELTTAHGQLAEVRDLTREVAEAVVRHVALAEVERAEPGAAGGQREDGCVRDRSTASGVEVAELVAVGYEVTEASVRHTITFGHGQISVM